MMIPMMMGSMISGHSGSSFFCHHLHADDQVKPAPSAPYTQQEPAQDPAYEPTQDEQQPEESDHSSDQPSYPSIYQDFSAPLSIIEGQAIPRDYQKKQATSPDHTGHTDHTVQTKDPDHISGWGDAAKGAATFSEQTTTLPLQYDDTDGGAADGDTDDQDMKIPDYTKITIPTHKDVQKSAARKPSEINEMNGQNQRVRADKEKKPIKDIPKDQQAADAEKEIKSKTKNEIKPQKQYIFSIYDQKSYENFMEFVIVESADFHILNVNVIEPIKQTPYILGIRHRVLKAIQNGLAQNRKHDAKMQKNHHENDKNLPAVKLSLSQDRIQSIRVVFFIRDDADQ
jgi:hypothetical protein